MKDLIKLFKVETTQEDTYYFDSQDEFSKFLAQNKSLFKSMSIQYGEKQTEDEKSYCFLANSTADINIDKVTSDQMGSYYDTDGHQYRFASNLIKRNNDTETFYTVMDRYRYEHIGPKGGHGDIIHDIEEKVSNGEYVKGCDDYAYKEKILVLTHDSVNLLEIDRSKKIFLGKNTQALPEKFYEHISLFALKQQKDALVQQIHEKKAELLKVEGMIECMQYK